MFKIDIKKWKEAVKAAETRREGIRLYQEAIKKWWEGKITSRELPPFISRQSIAEELTKLYSIRAMARGRVHRQRARLTWEQAKRLLPNTSTLVKAYQTFVVCQGSMKLTLDLEAQEKYVGHAWEAFVAPQADPDEEDAKTVVEG